MKYANARRLSAAAWLALTLFGCSPPSAVPLIHWADRAIAEQHQYLAQDVERNASWFDQQRAALAGGFEADLLQRPQLDPAWVLQGAQAYVAARETLLHHQLELQQANALRRRNLDTAREALRRAAWLIERQDNLLATWADPTRWTIPDKGD